MFQNSKVRHLVDFFDQLSYFFFLFFFLNRRSVALGRFFDQVSYSKRFSTKMRASCTKSQMAVIWLHYVGGVYIEITLDAKQHCNSVSRLGMSVTTQGGSGRQCVTGPGRNTSKYRFVLLNVYRFRDT